jgi:Ca-activated chloride channel family protein
VRAVAEDEGNSDLRHFDERSEQGPGVEHDFQAHLRPHGRQGLLRKTWQKQVEAFESIREDLGNSYTVTYCPAANPNEGFRKIGIEIASDVGTSIGCGRGRGIGRAEGFSAACARMVAV